MNKQPRKVEEPQATYAARKLAKAAPVPAKRAGQPADDATFKRVADKLFSERKELLHKLAQ